VVRPGQWRPTVRVDASLAVLAALDHEVSRRGAYQLYVGSGEHPVRLRVLGATALPPGSHGLVRLHLPAPLPLLPGDRFVLRESGRNETVGGGEVLDVAPVLPASRARPDRRPERVVAERGWVDVDELEALTGVRLEPVLGRWVATPGAVEALVLDVVVQVAAAGPLGLDPAALDDRARAAVHAGLVPETQLVEGRVVRGAAADPLADHPFVAALAAGGCSPPAPDGVPRDELRALVRRGLVVERDGVWFHPDAVEKAALAAARLLAAQPEGFTVGALRDAVGATRKHAVPLAAELDARGVTRRRGDLRIAGPRLPSVG
jgi:selenocysteine-specific elongation factor